MPGADVQYYYEGELKVDNLIPSKTYTNLRKVTVSSTHVKLAWDKKSLTQLNDMEDKVQYKAVNDEEWQTSTVVCQEHTATIQNLKPATKYKFRIQAPGQIFLRENDEPLEVTTEHELSGGRGITFDIFTYVCDFVCFLFGRFQLKSCK